MDLRIHIDAWATQVNLGLVAIVGLLFRRLQHLPVYRNRAARPWRLIERVRMFSQNVERAFERFLDRDRAFCTQAGRRLTGLVGKVALRTVGGDDAGRAQLVDTRYCRL